MEQAEKSMRPTLFEEDSLQITYLTPSTAEFYETAGGFAGLKMGEKDYPRITVTRMFPMTDADRYLSIREPDPKAKEIGMIQNLTDFPGETVALLRRQLELRYFMPKITAIHGLKEEYGYGYFSVDTDKGPCKFVVHIYGRAFVRLSEYRYVITDIDSNRFEIPDIRALSAAERRKLDLYL